MSKHKRDRQGFTLVELIVVIGIIGMLVGLLLPTIHRVREAANRASCSNNLKQLGLAIQSHAAEHGGLPTLGLYDDSWDWPYPPSFVDTGLVLEQNDKYRLTRGVPSVPNRQFGGWGFQLLPFLDQESLYRGSDSRGYYLPSNEETLPFDIRARGIDLILSTPLRVFSCPSRGGVRVRTLSADSFQSTFTKSWFTGPEGPGRVRLTSTQIIWLHKSDQPIQVAQTDYAANGGISIGDKNGPLWYTDFQLHQNRNDPGDNRRIAPLRTLKTIRDGLSNTVVIGEKLVNRANLTKPTDLGDLYGYASSYGSSNVRFCGGPPPRPVLVPQQDYSSARIGSNLGFGSAHTSATMFAFADGSVHGVSHSVDGGVFYALCIVNDGRAVTESDYE